MAGLYYAHVEIAFFRFKQRLQWFEKTVTVLQSGSYFLLQGPYN
jgi:hypothetical protein